ncbi:hypothetical protein MY5147_004228 [Beauveria neobassiana]
MPSPECDAENPKKSNLTKNRASNAVLWQHTRAVLAIQHIESRAALTSYDGNDSIKWAVVALPSRSTTVMLKASSLSKMSIRST